MTKKAAKAEEENVKWCIHNGLCTLGLLLASTNYKRRGADERFYETLGKLEAALGEDKLMQAVMRTVLCGLRIWQITPRKRRKPAMDKLQALVEEFRPAA